MTTSSGQLTTYAYEPNRKLKTQVKNEFNTTLISQYDYTYNNLGLRDDLNTSGEAFSGSDNVPVGKAVDYTTNELNQYTEINTDIGSLTADNLSYDDDGNLTSIISTNSTKVYEYNGENRLISVEPETPVDGDTKVEFVYDYMGRRVQKKVYSYISDLWSLTSDTLFFYDDWNMIQEMDGTETIEKSYVYGLDLSQSSQGAGGVGGLLSSIQSQVSSSWLFCYDANGNVGELINSDDGSIVANYEYDPFGILLKSTGSMADENSFRFSTKYYDTETDLYYYGYRYYSTKLGRWVNRDPLYEEEGLNLYSYVMNDGINAYDMLGLLTTNQAIAHYFRSYPIVQWAERSSKINWHPDFPDKRFDPIADPKGDDLYVSFKEIDIGVHPRNFPDFEKLLTRYYKKTVEKNIYMTWYTDIGEYVAWAGHIEYTLKGIFKSDFCEWEFSGSIGALPNDFDFNPKTKEDRGQRGWIGERVVRTINYFGPKFGGKDYTIYFIGDKTVKDNEKW